MTFAGGGRRTMSAAALVPVAMALLASCSHLDKPKKHKREKHRDPIEQKVFYDGWWPDR